MKKIGLLSQMDQVIALPKEVRIAMEQILTTLEENYGVDRDIEKELGGYIAVVDCISDIADLKRIYLDIEENCTEWVDEINTANGEVWIQALYILSNDFAVAVVGRKEILGL